MTRVRILALVLLLGASFAPPEAFGQTATEIRQQIEAHSSQIEALNKEIAAFEKQLNTLGSQKQTLQNTLAQIDISRKKIAASISVTKNRIGTLELEIQNLSRGIATAEGAISVNEAGLAESIRRLNEAETRSLVLDVLSSDGLSTLWDDMEEGRQIQEAIHTDITQLSEQKTVLTETKTATEEKQGELVVQQKKLLGEQGSLDATRRAQNELLAETKSQESNYQTLLKDKQTAKAAFERAMEELESKLEFTLDPSRVPPAGRGILRWPLDNAVNALCNAQTGRNQNCLTQYFGKTADSGRLYSSGTHNGVDFRASIGTPVKAALSGTVLGTGNTDGGGCYSYGKWILIRHGNGLSTLYAHLSQINVTTGEPVSTGAVIGFSGFTGYATGPHLHFTVFASEGVQIRDLGAVYRENGLPATTACAKKGVMLPTAAQSAYLDPMDYL